MQQGKMSLRNILRLSLSPGSPGIRSTLLTRLTVRPAYQIQYLSTQDKDGSGEYIYHHPERDEVPIPLPKERPNEPMTEKRARLLYQSRKRGMLENGLLLSTFASKFLDGLTEPQLKMYDDLINKPTNDWDIYYWITGNKPTPEEYNNEIMDMLKEHAQNRDKQQRLRQPDLPVH